MTGPARWAGLLVLGLGGLSFPLADVSQAQTAGPGNAAPATVPPPSSPANTGTPAPAGQLIASEYRDLAAAAQWAGQPVEAVNIQGNAQVSSDVIRQLIRTRAGDKFDPQTVVEDYQRVYDKMRLFANVEAKVQRTASGVIVVFNVTEQKQIHEIRFEGNVSLKTNELQQVVDLRTGEAIDTFRVNQARQAIFKLYKDKNYPFAHIDVPTDVLTKNGDVVFKIVEGPQVTIRAIDFVGNNSFPPETLRKQITTDYYLFIFRAGTFDPEVLDTDVTAIRRFYTDKGFFDARVGRKLTRSPDMREMQITFVIDEGARYTVSRVEFKGVYAVTESALRQDLSLVEGRPYDQTAVDADIRAIVRAYSNVGGYIYEQKPGIMPNPDYLQIRADPVYEPQAGKVRLVYTISEGRPFRVGDIHVKGNTRTKDNVVERELRIRPGQLFNSAEVLDAEDRLRGEPYFNPQTINITPIGEDPNVRDLLVEVGETRTAQVSAGIGVNSNGGFGGQLSYEQKNFDITNFPSSWSELFSDRAFAGAGQDFRASFSPGTLGTNAVVSWTEPYLFDQPYSLSTSAYLNDRIRENYNDDRYGGSVTVGRRFNYVYSSYLTLQGEDVVIRHVTDPEVRAPEIVAGQGHHTLTSVGVTFRRDTTNHGPITFKGTDTEIGLEEAGALGGTVNYSRVTGSFNDFQLLNDDLLDRKTVLNSHVSFGWDPQHAPFYERFYGGGLGSLRGFVFRGISPRSGPFDDPVGGDFTVSGGLELQFPLAQDFLRGVLFADAGDVENNAHFGTIRSSVGFGLRINVPFLGQAPIAVDFGFPLTQNRQDRTQVLSFSLGFSR